MDRNLGAIQNVPGSLYALGLYYQWGRKDPFPRARSTSLDAEMDIYNQSGGLVHIKKVAVADASNFSNAVKNPITFYYSTTGKLDWYTLNGTQNDGLWSATKTIYDPCPTGWKVANQTSWSGLTNANFTADAFNLGRTHNDYGGWYPAAGGRFNFDANRGLPTNVGSYGYWWTNAVTGTNAYGLRYYSGVVDNPYTLNRGHGMPVRCIQE